MIQRLIDDLKTSAGSSLRMTSLLAAAGLAGLIALGFACAAAFIAVMERYGAIYACLTLAGVFLVLSGIVIAVHQRKQRNARERAAAAARAAARAAANAPLIDPMMVATGIQIARSIGLKKLVPILALVGVAAGYMARRGAQPDDGDQDHDNTDDAHDADA